MGYYAEVQYRQFNLEFDKLYYPMFFKKGTKILDVGCSVGTFMMQDPSNITGIDIDKEALKEAKKHKLKAFYCDAEKGLSFKSNEFEAVNCRHIIEHLSNPLSFMKEIRRVLKPKGKAVVMTDAPTKAFWDDYTHKQPFTIKSLERLAYDAGFRDFKVYSLPHGIPFLGLLYRNNLISASLVKSISKLIGRIVPQHTLIFEGRK